MSQAWVQMQVLLNLHFKISHLHLHLSSPHLYSYGVN